MSRTYRNDDRRTHDRKGCPWCQENLHHKHKRHETPLFEEEDYEPDRVLEREDED